MAWQSPIAVCLEALLGGRIREGGIMMSESNLILACPHCAAFAKVKPWSSRPRSTQWSSRYTDGRVYPTLGKPKPAIARCKCCGIPYWLDDADVVWDACGGTPLDADVCERASCVEEEPSEDDFAEAVAAGLATNREREHYLRVHLWWAANNNQRRGETTNEAVTRRRQNMEVLASILDESDGEERLMKAELARETGHFDEARRLLDFPFDRRDRHRVAKISELIEQNCTRVDRVWGNEGLTAEEKRVIAEEKRVIAEDKARQEAERRNREDKREAIMTRQKLAIERGRLKEGGRCPKCGFSYAWDGTDCHHCHYNNEGTNQ
jgi:hypothetical protein